MVRTNVDLQTEDAYWLTRNPRVGAKAQKRDTVERKASPFRLLFGISKFTRTTAKLGPKMKNFDYGALQLQEEDPLFRSYHINYSIRTSQENRKFDIRTQNPRHKIKIRCQHSLRNVANHKPALPQSNPTTTTE